MLRKDPKVTGHLASRIELFLARPPIERSAQAAPGIAIGSLQGPERPENEDRAIVAVIAAPDLPTKLIAVVCDGLGGMSDGGKAATVATSAFVSRIVQLHLPLSPKLLFDAIDHANNRVFEELRGDGGTTLVAFAVDQNFNAWHVHAGDSRIYSSDGNGQLTLLTKDDTFARLVSAESHPEDRLDNRLLQFVGVGNSLEPHIERIEGVRSNRFILTTDGAHGLGRSILEGIDRNASNCADWIKKLTFVAEASSVRDNASAIAISLKEMLLESPPQAGLTIKMWSPSEVLEICYPDYVKPIPSHDVKKGHW